MLDRLPPRVLGWFRNSGTGVEILDGEVGMQAEAFFADQWSDMSTRIGRSLAGAGCPVDQRQDVLQETALRLWRNWDAVDPDRPVEPYARTVALNVWRDDCRRRAGREEVGFVPEFADESNDVERICLGRLELQRVGKAMTGLSEVERSLLLSEMVGRQSAGSTRDAVRMARMRARRRLTTQLEKIAGFSPVPLAARAWGALHRAACRWASPDSTAASYVMILGVVGTLCLPAVPAIASAQGPVTAHRGTLTAAWHWSASGRLLAQPTSGQTVRATSHPTAIRASSRAAAGAADYPYYVVPLPGHGSARAFVSVVVNGQGVKVEQNGKSPVPVCTVGVSVVASSLSCKD